MKFKFENNVVSLIIFFTGVILLLAGFTTQANWLMFIGILMMIDLL